MDETCEHCKFSFGPLFLACGNKRSEFFEGPVLPVGWCPQFQFSEEACPGHVASDGDPKVCGRCGLHIDSMRPDDGDG